MQRFWVPVHGECAFRSVMIHKIKGNELFELVSWGSWTAWRNHYAFTLITRSWLILFVTLWGWGLDTDVQESVKSWLLFSPLGGLKHCDWDVAETVRLQGNPTQDRARNTSCVCVCVCVCVSGPQIKDVQRLIGCYLIQAPFVQFLDSSLTNRASGWDHRLAAWTARPQVQNIIHLL